ncbi:MAG TPA: hypothetical protein VHA78_01900 [Candidatus Peribacteraceae bacterium]|nr:hypothetical protein [Candidatus Peribacteraceae bacterium]
MLSRKYIEKVSLMMAQMPEPPEHERGQSVLAEHANRTVKEGSDAIRLSLGYVLHSSGDVTIMSRSEKLPEGARWMEENE